MEHKYNLFGWNREADTSHIAGPVTVNESGDMARALGLTSYHLAPLNYEERGAKTHFYVRHESGHYLSVAAWQWLEASYRYAQIYPPKEDVA